MRGAAAVIAHTDAETRADSSDAETRRTRATDAETRATDGVHDPGH